MSRVRIHNTSHTHIGFSFGFLFKGQRALVEESRLSVGDRRMIAKKNLTMEPEVVVASKPKEKAEKVTLDGPEDERAPKKDDTITTASLVADSHKVPMEPGPVVTAPVAEAEPETPAKPKLTEEQLKGMTKTELKKLSEGLGADGRSRASMIAKILESQEK